jgi:signal transduction protein with GAF and PtsI domain
MTDDLAADFRRLLLSIEATGHAVLPRTNEQLLQSIVEAAARIFGAGAASILLVNEADQMLEFVIATGETQKAVVGLTMPLDKGIAGYVAMTGQPIAVSKVQQDARFHAEVAIRTGYMPDSILAAPLLSGDRVIGVMEVLDKIQLEVKQDSDIVNAALKEFGPYIRTETQALNLDIKPSIEEGVMVEMDDFVLSVKINVKR